MPGATETKQGTLGGDSHRRSVSLGRTGDEPQREAHHLSDRGCIEGLFLALQRGGPRWWRGFLLSSRGISGPQGEWSTYFCPVRGNCVWLRQGPHATGCSAGGNQGGGRKCGPLLGGSPHMGSGSFLSRKTLVQFPDFFLISPQFLHRAFSLSNKVNKCQ